MAKLAINILIEKRKNIEKDSKIYSIISFLFHALIISLIFLYAGYSRYKIATKPKVYRVSIATLPSLSTSKTQHPTPKTQNLKPNTQNPKPKTQHPKPKTQNPKPKPKAAGINTKTKHLKPKTQNPKPNTQNLKPKTQNPAPKTQHPTPGTLKKGFSNSASSIMDLDTTSFDYAYYLAIVRDKIGNNWVRTYTGNGKVKIYFKIMKNGEIRDAKVEISSGNEGLDRLALDAVLKSNPLPPLPEGFRENYIGIHIWFNYEE